MAESSTDRFVCIVGAPRSGTTSLSTYLREHSGICFSAVKEPHYFSQHDLTGLAEEALRARVEQEYLGRFYPDRNGDGRMLAEGSVSYLYTPEQMAAVVRMWPEARFVLAVRNPLDMLPSLHQRLLFIGSEVVPDFETAWALCADRRAGHSIPRTCPDARWLLYDEIGKIGAYVERFFAAVGRERCFVSVFDDILAEPKDVYRDLLAFLDLPYEERSDFVAQRPSQGFRSGALQRLLKRPPRVVGAAMGGEKYFQRMRRLDDAQRPPPVLVRAVFAARRRLLDWNRTSPPPLRVSEAFREQLADIFAPDVARLSQLIERDLGHWVKGSRSASV